MKLPFLEKPGVKPMRKPVRKLLFPAIAAALAVAASVTAAVADPLWSWGDDEWGYDAWSYHDRAYRPSGYEGWWSRRVILPYVPAPTVQYPYGGYGYNPYAAYPAGYHFGFWGACNCLQEPTAPPPSGD